MSGRHAAPRAGLRGRRTGWLPPGRAARQLLLIFFADAVGTGLFLAGSALFFTGAIGLDATQVGFGLSLSGVTGLLCTVPLGRLADRLGGRRTLVLLFLWRGSGFLAYVFVDGFLPFLVVACLLGAAEWAVGPVIQATMGAVEEPGSRVRTMAAVNAARNAGFMLGATLATLVLATESTTGYRGLVLANAVSFFLAAGLLLRVARPELPPGPPPAPERAVRVRDVRYLLLAAVNGVLFLHTVLLGVGLPLWIATRTEAPGFLVGVVVTVNTVLAITLGVRLSRRVDGVRAGATRHRWSGWALAACCGLVALSAGAGSVQASLLLLAATLFLTLGELWQSMGGWALSYALSPEDRRSYYVSVYNAGEPVAASLGPLLLTAGVIQAGGTGWLLLAAVFALTGTAVRGIALYGRRTRRGRRAGIRPVPSPGPAAPVRALAYAGGVPASEEESSWRS